MVEAEAVRRGSQLLVGGWPAALLLLSLSCGHGSVAAARAPSPPKLDTDGDGLTDDIDQCPRDAEQINGIDDDDGCPDRPRDCVASGPILLEDAFNFRQGATEFVRDETPVLDALAATLVHNSQIELVAVRGNAGDAERRRAPGLALARARHVRQELIRRGVGAVRLRAEALPAACPPSASGYATVSRVDLRVLQDAGAPRSYSGPCKEWRAPVPCH